MERETSGTLPVPGERIINKIFLIRGKKVMIDSDLAELYGVATKVFNQAVKRNRRRFPDDFMFQLTKREMEIWRSQFLRSQFVTSNGSRGGRQYAPLAFTEQGVAMLSSVLNSERAIQVNIQIVRTFTKLREMIATHKELRQKIEEMERKYDKNFRVVFEAIGRLLEVKDAPKKPIGFQGRRLQA